MQHFVGADGSSLGLCVGFLGFVFPSQRLQGGVAGVQQPRHCSDAGRDQKCSLVWLEICLQPVVFSVPQSQDSADVLSLLWGFSVFFPSLQLELQLLLWPAVDN